MLLHVLGLPCRYRRSRWDIRHRQDILKIGSSQNQRPDRHDGNDTTEATSEFAVEFGPRRGAISVQLLTLRSTFLVSSPGGATLKENHPIAACGVVILPPTAIAPDA